MRNPDYDNKKLEHEVIEEMKGTGKDLTTVLWEKLPRSDKKLPRIHKEVVMEELIALKNQLEKL